MPRDLPTRRVFLSRSHFVSFIPLSTTTCGLRPRSGRSGDALPCYFFTLGSTMLFMSHSFRWRVGHPARAVFGTLRRKSWNASIHQKWKIIINRQWYYFFANQSAVILYHAVSLLLDILPFANMWDVDHPGPLAMHAELQGSHPGCRAAVTMTNEPSNHRPTSHFEVARTKEPSWLHWIPLLEENYCTSSTASYSSYSSRGLLFFETRQRPPFVHRIGIL